jgi:hypothetical protein
MSKNVPVNLRSEINACWYMGKFCMILECHCSIYSYYEVSICDVHLSFPCMCSVSEDSVDALNILRKSSDNWCYDTHLIRNPLLCSINDDDNKWHSLHVWPCPCQLSGNMLPLCENIIHNGESHPTNYSPNLTSNWANLGLLLHRH